jgi:uncharacterized membrane protein YfcA
MCKHKDVFPLLGREIIGTFVLMILMALSVMSGIGGGGIIVPLLMAFYDLETKTAIAVSGFTILTGSIARYLITLNERHPDKDATSVEYGLSNVMLPTILIGSLTGVFFNMMLPVVVLQGLLVLLLGFLTYNSAKKARSIYRKENKRFEEEKRNSEADQDHEGSDDDGMTLETELLHTVTIAADPKRAQSWYKRSHSSRLAMPGYLLS